MLGWGLSSLRTYTEDNIKTCGVYGLKAKGSRVELPNLVTILKGFPSNLESNLQRLLLCKMTPSLGPIIRGSVSGEVSWLMPEPGLHFALRIEFSNSLGNYMLEFLVFEWQGVEASCDSCIVLS